MRVRKIIFTHKERRKEKRKTVNDSTLTRTQYNTRGMNENSQNIRKIDVPEVKKQKMTSQKRGSLKSNLHLQVNIEQRDFIVVQLELTLWWSQRKMSVSGKKSRRSLCSPKLTILSTTHCDQKP